MQAQPPTGAAPSHGPAQGAAVDTLQTVNPAHCPVCGQPNHCAMEQARLTGVPEAGPCWCTRVVFTEALLAQVPVAARGSACICEACARQAAAGSAGEVAA